MKKIISLIIICVFSVSVFGWDYSNKSTTLNGSSFMMEQNLTETNQKRLLEARPPVSMVDSLERKQINSRTELWNNPSKVAYLYIFGHGGQCLGFYVIKGKVSSVNSQVTNPTQIKSVYHSGTRGFAPVPSPAEDGSYGSNGDGIFFFTTSGVYIETNLDYILADQPLKLKTLQLN